MTVSATLLASEETERKAPSQKRPVLMEIRRNSDGSLVLYCSRCGSWRMEILVTRRTSAVCRWCELSDAAEVLS